MTTRKRMLDFVYRSYGRLFARPEFYGMNRLLFNLSLRGLGILNYQNSRLSGEDAFLRNVLAHFEAPTILDVGANVGTYSTKIKRAFPAASVYAFEPHPITFSHLSQEAIRHGYVAINAACGEKAGSATLYDYNHQPGSSHASMYPEVLEQLHRQSVSGISVNVVSLTDFVREQAVEHINLLKIDTEGHEYSVLKGARPLLRDGRIDMIHFEFNEMNVVSRTFAHDFFELLDGFEVFRMLPGHLLNVTPYAPLRNEVFAYQNLVAIRNDCVARLPAVAAQHAEPLQ